MKKVSLKNSISIAFCLILLSSCGNSSQGNTSYYYNELASNEDYYSTEVMDEYQEDWDEYTDDHEYNDETDENVPSLENIRLTGMIETCNKCMGYGMVQDGMYGQPQICKFCWISTWMRMNEGWTGFDGRYGQVDAIFNKLPADYFDELDWDAGGASETHEEGSNQIESEIARHEANIAQLEHQLEYIEGSVNRIQIQQQIIEEQNEIKRLKGLLNNME